MFLYIKALIAAIEYNKINLNLDSSDIESLIDLKGKVSESTE